MIWMIPIGIAAAGIGIAVAVAAATETDEEADATETADHFNDEAKRAKDAAQRAEAQARQSRRQAKAERLVRPYGITSATGTEILTWAAAGRDGIMRIERALRAGASDTAKKLRYHDNRRRQLLELQDEVIEVAREGQAFDG